MYPLQSNTLSAKSVLGGRGPDKEGDDEDGFKYETEAPSTAFYMTPPSTGGWSEPSAHPLHSPLPQGSNPENNVALQTSLIEAHVDAFLAEANENLKLHDLLPLENVAHILIHIPTIPGFVPFTMSTSQHCVPSKGLPRAFHPYENSVGQCCCEAGGWYNNLPCSGQKE